jgi:hypothetical protein
MESPKPEAAATAESSDSAVNYSELLAEAQAVPAVDRDTDTAMQGEHLTPSIPEAEHGLDAAHSFTTQLDRLVGGTPELGERREQIERSAREIIEKYEIKPELFADEGRALVFGALADRWAESSNATDVVGEEQFLSDALVLLGHGYSDTLGSLYDATNPSKNGPSEAEQLKAYDRFTDHQLSADLRRAVDAGLLGEVKGRLGITHENEDPFEIRVLSIGDATGTYGLAAPRFPDDLPENRDEKLLLMKTHSDDVEAVKEWRKGLEKRGQELATALGEEGLFATAWITEVEGKTLLCLPAPVAEKLLDSRLTDGNAYYSDIDRDRDIASFEHEYTHTQGGVNANSEVSIGMNLEELRAEHFSGNKLGYQEVKGFFNDIAEITGKPIKDDFDGRIKGGTSAEIYAELASQVGLSSMLEVVMIPPANYLRDQSNEYIRRVDSYLGRFDGTQQRIYEKLGDSDEMRARIDARARKFLDVTKGDYEAVVSQRRNHGRNFVTDMVEQRIHEIVGEVQST